MSTGTLRDGKIDGLEDFELVFPCEIELVLQVFRRLCIVLKRCRRTATWAGTCPQCRNLSYVCETHYMQKTLVHLCQRCDHTFYADEVKWIRL